MSKVFIAAAKRSAIGAFGGSLKDMKAPAIAAEVIKGALNAAGVRPEDVDYTVLGHVLQAGVGMGPGRQASLAAGIPEDKPGYTLNILCSSGMKALMTARASILAGEAEVIVAGGMENMSGAPFIVPSTLRWGNKLGGFETADHMIADGLTDVFNDYHMGITAENVAEKHGITREAQDAFALSSQKKAAAAIAAGKFTDEIVPVEVQMRRGTVSFEVDEYPRSDATIEALAKLSPAFKKGGSVTAGNSSGINDGAAVFVVVSEGAALRLGLEPLAEVEAV
ncbi:MAG: acetyl-CoA C-acyltransferase, partial [Spirochaetaceae bacterium]|nr:acetyl-CoA C-acyltransferase [Spirochaetaceae bacterium]